MKIETHAVPIVKDGHEYLRITSDVIVAQPTEPDSHDRLLTVALWDTGATNTCIPMDMAIEMGIPLGEPSSVTKMKSTEQSRYCQFRLQFPDGSEIFVEEAIAIPNMKARVIIGMDVIRKGVTTIEPDGEDGVRFTFRM